MNNNITIRQGDALREMRDVAGDSVDLVIADPPYNLGKQYGNNHDRWNFDEYLEFSRLWLTEARRILKPTGTIYVFMGFKFISYIFDIMERQLNMEFINWICWHYTQGIGRTKGFSPRHDDILMFGKSANYTFNLDEIRVPQKYFRDRNNMRGANPGDVWMFSHVHYCNGNRQNHPTQKPEGLIERMLLASTNIGELVVDPFAGSGTTLRVCQQLERKCLGIELNPEYVEMMRTRLEKPFTGFDSVDPRMERIPLDLRNAGQRERYLLDHKRWFLRNHENAVEEFERVVSEMYGDSQKKLHAIQPTLGFE